MGLFTRSFVHLDSIVVALSVVYAAGCAIDVTPGRGEDTAVSDAADSGPEGARGDAASGQAPDSGPGGGDYFATLPVGASLPDDEECAARVRAAAEVRPQNAPFVSVTGTDPHDELPRVTGNFSGTTDEVLQWAACKWGIDENIVRAQIAIESYWDQRAIGDGGESFGLGQVRVPYHGAAFEDDNAKLSAAYNVDYTYAVWRGCFEGEYTWLNQFDPPTPYAAGDLEGCLGAWFSGRWYTPEAVEYIGRVNEYLADEIWTSEPFLSYVE